MRRLDVCVLRMYWSDNFEYAIIGLVRIFDFAGFIRTRAPGSWPEKFVLGEQSDLHAADQPSSVIFVKGI